MEGEIMDYQTDLKTVTDHELLAAFLGEHNDRKRCLELRTQFWNTFPTLADYKHAPQRRKDDFFGSTDKSLCQLLIGIEIGERIARASRPLLGNIYSSKQVGEKLITEFRNDQQENLCLICLDVKHRIISQQIIFKGTLTTCPVHPREIFAVALEQHAESILIAHNHPSGMTEPSTNDIEFTHRLEQCGQLLGINLLDSFVIGQCDYLSLREEKIIEAAG